MTIVFSPPEGFVDTHGKRAQTFTLLTYDLAGGNANYAPPTGCKWLKVTLKGAGAGGAGSGVVPGTGLAPADVTTFGTFTADYGRATTSSGSVGGIGGVAATSTNLLLGMAGHQGGNANATLTNVAGGNGGGQFGGYSAIGTAGQDAIVNSGAGGGGAGTTTNNPAGAGGGEGATTIVIIPNPQTIYLWLVPDGGAGGAAGGAGFAGGKGGAGYILVEEFY